MKTIYLLLLAAAVAAMASCAEDTIYYRRTYTRSTPTTTIPGQAYQLPDRNDADHFRAATDR